ncbi:MAG: hypothetical protein R6U04_06135 [Bacteroidales bacterium]
MTKIIQKVTIILSLLLLITTALAPASHAASLDKQLDDGTFVLDVYDEELNDTIQIHLLYAEDGMSRVQAINSNREIIYDFTFDVNDQSMTSELTGEVVDIEISKNALQGMSTTSANYCTGSSYQNLSFTSRQIAAGIVGSVTLAAVTAKLVGLISAATGFKVAAGSVGTAALDALNAMRSGDYNKRIRFRMNFSCARMWESDPFHPSGGFYFYGWKFKSITYLGAI